MEDLGVAPPGGGRLHRDVCAGVIAVVLASKDQTAVELSRHQGSNDWPASFGGDDAIDTCVDERRGERFADEAQQGCIAKHASDIGVFIDEGERGRQARLSFGQAELHITSLSGSTVGVYAHAT